MNPTEEQLALPRAKGHLIIVSAFAGTGKTSALVLYAQAFPNVRMTYIAFSRAIKDEAEKKFPSNVKCVTGHGLAYGRFGTQYSHKLNNPRPFQLMSALTLDARAAGIVLSIVNNFLQSADMDITKDHVDAVVSGVQTQNAPAYLTIAKRAWTMMCDVDCTKIPMPHDGYLKLFQMSGGTINTEVILFDEAQDANPIIIAIVAASKGKKVFVGDENQSIFAFRGAINAMDDIKAQADEHLFLTASFRFGAGVARLANKILGQYRPMPKPIRGLGKYETSFSVDVTKKHTRLSRTNAVLFGEAVKALYSGRPFGFVGKVSNYGFETILDTYHLSVGSNHLIKDQTIKSFKTFGDMQSYAEAVDDKELKAKAKIVSEYTNKIPELVRGVQEKAIEDLTKVDIIMTTAHKSKGLEWDSVYLTDDFTDMLEKQNGDSPKWVEPEHEEINLLYVAVTRAERCLSVPEALHKWLEKVQYFEPIYERNNGLSLNK